MAENVQITPGTGVTIGADSVADGVLGSAQIQFIKIMDGTIGGTNKAAVSANGLTVDGSAVTQPISATSLPLPTGAATEATLASIGTSTDNLDVHLSTLATEVTASAIKGQTDKLTFVASALLVDGSNITQPISVVALPLPTGASTETTLLAVKDDVDNLDVALSTRASEATLANVKSDLDKFTFISSALLVDGSGVLQPVAISQVGTDNNVEVINFPSSQTINGTVAATQSGTWTVALSSGAIEIGTVDQGVPAVLTNAWPVLPTDGTNSQVFTATGEGQVAVTQPLPAGTNVIGHVIADSGSTTAVTGNVSVVQATAANLNATITGTVVATQSTGSNLHTVVDSGSITVANSTIAVTQSGTWNLNNITGTVSLPTGASTAAKQPALGTSGTSSSDVITVQGIIGMTALKVDGSAVTQPVSGTITANQGTSPWVVSVASTTITGTVAVTQSTSPWVVSGTVTSNIGTTNGLALDATVAALEVAQASTTSGQKGILQLGAVTTGSPTYTTAQTDALSLTTAGALRVDASATTQPISGSVTVANATIAVTQSGTWNINNISGTVSLPTGASTEATLASLNGKVTAVNTGAVTISTSLPAGTNVIGHVIADSGSTTAVTGNVSVVQTTAANLNATVVGAVTANAGTGNFTVVQATGTNLHTVVDSGTIAVTQATASSLNATVTQGIPASSTNSWPVKITDSGGTNQASVNATGQVSVVAPTITKGTQGVTGFTTQDLKDSGRTYVTFTADAVAGSTTEALLSMTQNVQGVATTAQTNYTVPNGKTLRIQSITVALESTVATGEWVRVKLRHNPAGATTTTSPLVYTVACGTVAATTGTSDQVSVPIPDGLEIFGNGTQTIGISHISSTATNSLESVTVCGYEY